MGWSTCNSDPVDDTDASKQHGNKGSIMPAARIVLDSNSGPMCTSCAGLSFIQRGWVFDLNPATRGLRSALTCPSLTATVQRLRRWTQSRMITEPHCLTVQRTQQPRGMTQDAFGMTFNMPRQKKNQILRWAQGQLYRDCRYLYSL